MEWPDVISRFSAREFRLCRRSRGVRHCVLLLAGRHRGMALRANLRANVVTSGSISFARPPSRLGEMFLTAELPAYGRRYLGRRQRHKKNYENQFTKRSHNASRTRG